MFPFTAAKPTMYGIGQNVDNPRFTQETNCSPLIAHKSCGLSFCRYGL